MSDCNCQMITTDELKALLEPDSPDEKEQAVEYLVGLLTSTEREDRQRGYELFEEAVKNALFYSCLNYGSLVGAFTHPLFEVVGRTVESWAGRDKGTSENRASSRGVQQ